MVTPTRERSTHRRMKLRFLGAIIVPFGLLLYSCGGSDDTLDRGQAGGSAGTAGAQSVCVPGESRACAGPQGCEGFQLCNSEGTALGTCDCGGSGAAGVGGASGANGAGGTSGAAGNGGTSGAAASGGSSGAAGTSGSAGASGTAGAAGSSCTGPQHMCSGVCTGNTIESGCFTSSLCLACPPPPLHGTEVCSNQGQCDFICDQGYSKNGIVCQPNPGTCSDTDCLTSCATQTLCGRCNSSNQCECVDWAMCGGTAGSGAGGSGAGGGFPAGGSGGSPFGGSFP